MSRAGVLQVLHTWHCLRRDFPLKQSVTLWPFNIKGNIIIIERTAWVFYLKRLIKRNSFDSIYIRGKVIRLRKVMR